VPAAIEIGRVVPVIEAIAHRFDFPISVDTSKAAVAEAAVAAGAEIVNDVSGLRFDEGIGELAARRETGLVLMHLRGSFETMHEKDPAADIVAEVARGFRESLETARRYGVSREQIALDLGIGFGKTLAQNLELLAKLDKLAVEFSDYPILSGTSRKSFLGAILDDAPAGARLQGSTASAAVAVWNGAKIVRVHDVRATVETLRVVEAIKNQL
jgi:dihydropteroate synthase